MLATPGVLRSGQAVDIFAGMREVSPEVELVARPFLDLEALQRYLSQVGAEVWFTKLRADLSDGLGQTPEAEALVEVGGRLCYRSWEPGLNANVTRVRDDRTTYLDNVLASKHGSVLEHANYSFIFHNVSRVFTHELVRHRAGTAISQESMRYVRLTDIPFWFPDWVEPDLKADLTAYLKAAERLQLRLAERFGLDDDGTPFSEKKAKTSFMRRFAPDGVATGLLWTANVRTLRHVIALRTAPGAEEEIRLVFQRVGELMAADAPALFGDFELVEGSWVPGYEKV